MLRWLFNAAIAASSGVCERLLPYETGFQKESKKNSESAP